MLRKNEQRMNLLKIYTSFYTEYGELRQFKKTLEDIATWHLAEEVTTCHLFEETRT